MIQLPLSIDREAWEGFCEMREAIETAQDLFAYDPETGVITRKKTFYRGQTVGQAVGSVNGRYLRVGAPNRRWHAHRLAWALYYGEMPAGEIDHINGNGRDNRIENLRACSRTQNCQNIVKRVGISGKTNVRPVGNRFRASISVNAKPKHIGYFATSEEAFEAAKAASIKYRGEFSAHVSRT